MAKIVVQNDADPAIAIVLTGVSPGDTMTLAQGWRGRCTQCGWPMHRWTQANAIASAQRHVDKHEAEAVGEDRTNWVRR